MAPIQRLTEQDRVIAFERQSQNIYNKFSPYEGGSDGTRFGFQQPYVWTKISDSTTSKNLTKYDTQTFPIGSTVRDVQRMGKFMASGTGLLYIGQQYLLQKQTAFTENRIYNPLSILSATAAKGTTGLIERPTRHLEGGGNGFGTFAASSLLSLAGISVETDVVGVASGELSMYARVGNKAKGKGLVHFEAAKGGLNRFSSVWGQSVQKPVSSGIGGFLQELGTSLLNKFVPSTQPFGFGNTETSNWVYRPEYPTNGNNGLDSKGVYQVMLDDTAGMLADKNKSSITSPTGTGFLNTIKRGIQNTALGRLFGGATASNKVGSNFSKGAIEVREFHRYSPGETSANTEKWYTKKTAINAVIDEDEVGATPIAPVRPQQNIKSYQLSQLATVVGKFQTDKINLQSIERYSNVNGIDTKNDYNSIPNSGDDVFEDLIEDPITLDARGFSKASTRRNVVGTADTYNMMLPFKGERTRANGEAPDELMLQNDYVNSKDVIFFYFYDLVNSIYIPFRATISGMNDLHSPDWDEVSYLGRADKLYVYKGFTREVNFSFTVYANSLKELVPMWKRINYLVGLSRPSKYTQSPGDFGDETENSTTQFMYPPMTTIRLGDMFVDQPCVLKSIGVNIPDDAQWETQRGTDFTYLKGVTGINFANYNVGDSIYQLPTKVDITINMSIMEKARSITGAEHYFVDPTGQGRGANLAKDVSSLTSSPQFLKGTSVFGDPSTPKPDLTFNNVSDKANLSLSNPGNVNSRQFSSAGQSLTISSPNSLPSFDTNISTNTSLLPPTG